MDVFRSIVTLWILIATSCSLPVVKNKNQMGPCIGMDCMHGILMHNDAEAGDDHRNEDAYKKLQEMDENAGKEKGPCSGGDCLHGVLMHGDDEVGDDHAEEDAQQEEIGPQKALKQGPCEGMDCLHGVLMHGDDDVGHDHKQEDERRAVESMEDSREAAVKGPCKGMDCMHGILMHNDDNMDEGDMNRDETDTEVNTGDHNIDLHGILHGEEGNEDVHNHPANDEEQAAEESGRRPVPGVADLHAMMHGDMDARLGDVPEEEKDDFQDWNSAEKKDDLDSGVLGYTFAFISDSLLNEIEVMKRRYLQRFWDDDTKPEPEIDRRFEKQEEPVEKDMRHDLDPIGNTNPLADDHHHGENKKTKKSSTHHDEGL